MVDAADRLLGVADLRQLIMAGEEQTLAEIMSDSLVTLDPENTLRDALSELERYSFQALPITDEHDKLLGVVSRRDLRGLKPRLD